MSWFRRRTEPEPAPVHLPNPAEAAVAFWQEWFELLPTVSAALGDGEPFRVEGDLGAMVAAMHPDLEFSLERGHRAIYALVITGREDPKLRPYTPTLRAACVCGLICGRV
jgi:hypothetical protein